MHWRIRPEESRDQIGIHRVHFEAFGREAEARIVEGLRGSEYWVPGLSLVAALGEEIIGHVLLSKIELRDVVRPVLLLALGPVAVRPDWQNRRVGTDLISHALGSAAGREFDGVIVLGHADYYPRFGFEPASRFGIRCPFEAPDENYLARELRGGGLKNTGGTVSYPPAWLEV